MNFNKRTFVVLLSILIVSHLYSQDIKTALKEVERSVLSGDYPQALQKLDEITDRLSNEYGEKLGKDIFPLSIGEYNQIKENAINHFNEGVIRINRTYQKTAEKDKEEKVEQGGDTLKMEIEQEAETREMAEQIVISINNSLDLIPEITQAHLSTPQVTEEGRIYKGVKIQGYRGLLVFDGNMGYGSLAILIGAATVQVDAAGFDNPDILTTTAEMINYEKIIERFGK